MNKLQTYFTYSHKSLPHSLCDRLARAGRTGIICGCNCATKHRITLEDKLDTESVTRNVSDTLIEPERFENFYSEFKTDTLLQKERVIYPLRGEYYWTENDSLDLGGEIDTTIYKVELKYLTPKMVEEAAELTSMGRVVVKRVGGIIKNSFSAV
eukprot:gene2670-3638_t